jgi:hypothetical protein
VFVGSENIEVIVAGLPEGAFLALHCYRKFQGLNGFGQEASLRLCYEEMDVLGHDDVAEDVEVVTNPHGFERSFEEFAGAWDAEVGLPSITTEGDEMGVSAGLIADQRLSHDGILLYGPEGRLRMA